MLIVNPEADVCGVLSVGIRNIVSGGAEISTMST